MILATVGTQLPFPRLLLALDRIAAEHGLRVVAQTYGPVADTRALEQHPFFAPAQFAALASEARLIVGHAGVGTILAASRAGKPLALYPRRAALGEHRNDHQMATAAAVEQRTGIYVAWDDSELERLLLATALVPCSLGASPTSPMLTATISEFIGQG